MAIVLSLISLIVFGFGANRIGGVAALTVGFLASASLYPKLLTEKDPTIFHVGISGPTPQLSTYTVVLLAAVVFLILTGRAPGSAWMFLPFIIWVVFGLHFLWDGTPEQWSGALQLFLAPAAWMLGAAFGRWSMRGNSYRASGIVIVLVFSIIVLQLVICVLQALGLPLNPMADAESALLPGRFNGTLNHPNNLGKVVVFLLAIVLPFSKIQSHHKRLVIPTWVCGVLVLALTGGRAVIVSALSIFAVTTVLDPEFRKNGRKWITACFGIVAALLSVSGVLLARFEEDPTGGARDDLLDLAWTQISQHSLAGVGPNSYVSAVGASDQLTASGVPVHNSFVLAIAELGWTGAVLLALPFVFAIYRYIRNIRSTLDHGHFARTGLALLPTIVFTGASGWGLLSEYIWPLFAFVMALLYQGSYFSKPQSVPGGLNRSVSGSYRRASWIRT